MKLQKKLVSLIAAGLLVFGVAACDGGGSGAGTDPATDPGAGAGAGVEPTMTPTP
jgi:hypothetical protein